MPQQPQTYAEQQLTVLKQFDLNLEMLASKCADRMQTHVPMSKHRYMPNTKQRLQTTGMTN